MCPPPVRDARVTRAVTHVWLVVAFEKLHGTHTRELFPMLMLLVEFLSRI